MTVNENEPRDEKFIEHEEELAAEEAAAIGGTPPDYNTDEAHRALEESGERTVLAAHSGGGFVMSELARHPSVDHPGTPTTRSRRARTHPRGLRTSSQPFLRVGRVDPMSPLTPSP